MPGRENIPSGYKEEWRYQEGDLTVTRTTQYSAPGCHDGCGILLYTDKDGKLVDVEGDPRNPYNKGRLCMRCLGQLEAVNHADRIRRPMRRVGERGSNQWEEITWEEALDEFKAKYDEVVAEYGEQAVCPMGGTGRSLTNHSHFAGAVFNTISGANAFLAGQSCYHPRVMAMHAVTGGTAVIDCAQMYEDSFDNPEWVAPECCIIWGSDPLKSNADGFYGHWVVDLMKQGTKFITIDPKVTWLGSRAEIALQVRPGTDTALSMAMLNVIIGEELYDKEFVANWCLGFKLLAKRVADATPEWASEICWVPAEDIRAAARLYATSKPASIHWGVSLDMYPNACFAAMSIVDLWTITGNLDVPGGNIMVGPYPDFRNVYRSALDQLTGDKARSDGSNDNIPGYKEFPLRRFNREPALADGILECLERKDPYEIKLIFMCNTNSIANIAAEAPRVFEAVSKVPYIVVCDCFITPTITAFADLVLPIAMSCECTGVRGWWAPIRTRTPVCDGGDAVGDEEMLRRLGHKFRPEVFPWETEREWIDHVLELMPALNGKKLSYDEIQENVYIYAPFEYKKYEKGLARRDSQIGFNTASGKCELYVSIYDAAGVDPLPHFAEPAESPYSTPELFEEFPLVLTTGQRAYEYFHSEQRQLKTMREFHPWPLLEINPKDAEKYGLKDGEWCWIQNVHGKCKQVVKFNEGMAEGVVSGEHGWWFPERDGSKEGGYFGVFESNINNLTTMCDVGDTGCGSPYRAQICKVYPVTSENEKYEMTQEELDRSFAARKHLVVKG